MIVAMPLLDQKTPAALLRTWIGRQASAESLAWLDAALAETDPRDPGKLAVALAMAGRKLGSAPLLSHRDELADADRVRAGWNPSDWTLGGAGMVLLLLAHAETAPDFGEDFQRLCQFADMQQLVAFYRGLPLYPASEKLDWQIGEGLRTSIASVFASIAHNSPLPAESFSEHRWNHMVLKALFIGSELQPIVGLEARRNPELAEILIDHVHERRAAGRSVDLQVWRCIAPYATDDRIDDIMALVNSPLPEERKAAALCLGESPDPRAAELLSRLPEEAGAMRAGTVSWSDLNQNNN